jgi:hypothetical protein
MDISPIPVHTQDGTVLTFMRLWCFLGHAFTREVQVVVMFG